jgi:wyosine [tRNA(Phe)-imidazoG37] synthetase (radical SAM superfamily)
MNIIFGPVPSRRLGRSLGINNIPPKICSYSCIYCQLGRTIKLRKDRDTFYPPIHIFNEVRKKVNRLQNSGEKIDYLTFVPDGEPTLDILLGEEIELLKSFRIPIAVITNSSFLWKEDVRKALDRADLVSLKIDSLDEAIWRKINRPHIGLKLSLILAGIRTFVREFQGKLVTETMLVKGLNDADANIGKIAAFLKELKPAKAYVSVPTRPPAEENVEIPYEEVVLQAFQIFKESGLDAELLTGYEGNEFSATGDVETDLLSITAVHPMREESVNVILDRAKEDWGIVRKLVDQRKLIELHYQGRKYYLRKM